MGKICWAFLNMVASGKPDCATPYARYESSLANRRKASVIAQTMLHLLMGFRKPQEPRAGVKTWAQRS